MRTASSVALRKGTSRERLLFPVPRTCSVRQPACRDSGGHLPFEGHTDVGCERTGPWEACGLGVGDVRCAGPAHTSLPWSLEGLPCSGPGRTSGQGRAPGWQPSAGKTDVELSHVCAMRPCPVMSRWAQHPGVAFRLCLLRRQVPHRGSSGWGTGFFLNSGCKDNEL